MPATRRVRPFQHTTRRNKKLHHYIITRLSVLDITPTRKSNTPGYSETKWYLKEQSPEEKKAYLFNPKRLSTKFNAFERMTAPSIKAQTYQGYTWLIYTSDQLPAVYKERLEKHEGAKIKIIYVKDFHSMEADLDRRLRGKTHYTTMRLDDDDGLNTKFLEEINKYATPKNKGAIISIPRGRLYTLRGNKIIYGSRVFSKRIALGLTAVGFNIMDAGIHIHVHKKHKIIYPTMNNAFNLFASKQSLTRRKFR
jgi:hypothetical protein